MKILDYIKSDANISITIPFKDLQEFVNYTINATRKELEKFIIDEKSEVYLTPQQVSEMLGVNLSTLFRWNKRGYLVPLEIGGKRKYRKSDINAKCFNKKDSN